MGALFSKKGGNKVAPDVGREVTSAPSRLEGLDGTLPQIAATRRAITPTTDYPGSAADTADSTPKKGPKKVDVIGKQTDGSQLAAALPSAAATLPEEVKPWVQVFDERTVKSLVSGSWKDREEGLSAVVRSITGPGFLTKKAPAESYAVAAEVCARSLKDKVAPIFHASLDLLQNILAVYANELPAQQLQPPLDLILPGLVHRCGNLNAKIHEAALQAIVNAASHPRLGTAFVGPFVLAPVPKVAKGANASAHMYGRLELIYQLLSNLCLGANSEGLGMDATLSFAKDGLEMPDEKVRTCAIKVVVEMYRLRKAQGLDLEPERYLGPVKPALLQILQRKFAEVSTELGMAGHGSDSAAVSTGVTIKVGKTLPPLGAQSLTRSALAPMGSGTIKPGSRPGTSLRPGTSSRHDADGNPPSPLGGKPRGVRPQPPSSPASTASPKKPTRRPAPPKSLLTDDPSSNKQSWKNTGGVLDDEDESLLRYIGGDEQ